MVRSTLLTAAAFGLWTQSTGEQLKAPCPSVAAYENGPLRIPAGCTAHAAGVWQTPEGWTAQEAQRAELAARITGLERELTEAKRRAENAESRLEQAQGRMIEDLSTLKTICTPPPPPACPTWTARLEGALFSAAACSAYMLGGYHGR